MRTFESFLKNQKNRRGLTLAEVIMATGFLAIFTTGLLAIATKAFKLAEREVDMAAVYQHAERTMEDLTLSSGSVSGWPALQSQMTPAFPTYRDQTGTVMEDKRFVQVIEVEELAPDLKFVTVTMYHSDPGETTATIDTSKPSGGEILDFVNLLQRQQ